KPSQAKPSQAKPSQAKQSQAKPSQAKPSQAKPSQAKPSQAKYRHREEVINTYLAILLTRHGVNAEAETIQQSGAVRPDVMFTMGGLRVIVEGKFADVPDADSLVLGDATKRIAGGICHIAVALVYPLALRTASTASLETTLSGSRLLYLIVSETGQTEWAEATPSEVLASLRRVHESLTKDDIVAESARKLSERIEGIAALWVGQAATCDRLSNSLGMPAKKGEKSDERDARHVTATKVASLVLANAMIFQEQLAASGGDGRVDSLRSYDKEPDPIATLKDHWHWIWTRINYVPIFQIGESILAEIPVSQSAIASIRWLMAEAKTICANQSALRHDLMGRIYHWLLHHAKYLGTYYTATSSATLLLKLTFSQEWAGQDFGAPKNLANFVVSDLACGTGTLLMASAQALTDQFIVSRVKSGRSLAETDLKNLHETLMENVLHGYDVLPSAVHLTASTLGMLAPNVTYRKMNLFVMPMGVQGRTTRLGSLDFIGHSRISTQLTLDNSQMEVKQTGIVAEHYATAEVPALDLCVMNPPFVRSVGGNLLFGSLPDDERAKLQGELKKRAKNLPASITAGLGSVFMAIADKHLRVGGRMAFILPVALATGEAWGASRKLIADGYHLETVIVSHDAERPNFSENTDLSEIMFIARKLKKNEEPGSTTYINLWYNPRTIYEALDVADRVRECIAQNDSNHVAASVRGIDGRKLAEIIQLPPTQGDAQWIGMQFAQAPALRTAVSLGHSELAVPGQPSVKVPLCTLSELGSLGYDQRDIHDAFTASETDWSPYPAFWNHEANRVVSLDQGANTYLSARTTPAPGRRLKDAAQVWNSAGRILLVERVRTTTHRVLAVGFNDLVLGNTWWAFKTELAPAHEKALLLWLNSTPSILLMLSHRVTTEGVWMKIKKPQWAAMPVLDVRSLPGETVSQLANAYEALCSKELSALAKLDSDPIRSKIDNALSAALGLPDMKPLRQLLAREPGLTGKSLSLKPGQTALFQDVDMQQEVTTQLRLI
ncbi:MAG: SAM-dependent methyltransferase, partial [Betaproteobacteria bacterium]|nr:SAM-dependent methyltransferase [Betaproteobacteria bacterium]